LFPLFRFPSIQGERGIGKVVFLYWGTVSIQGAIEIGKIAFLCWDLIRKYQKLRNRCNKPLVYGTQRYEHIFLTNSFYSAEKNCYQMLRALLSLGHHLK
jgi:hypothetical protein